MTNQFNAVPNGRDEYNMPSQSHEKLITDFAEALPVLTSEQVQTPQARQRVFTYNELRERDVNIVPTLFDSRIIKKGLGVVYGPADCGKSMWLRQMCACVASGRAFMGWRCNATHHRAIYFSSEDDADVTTPVIKYNDKTLQLSGDEGRNIRYVFDFSADEIPDLLNELLTDEPADLVIIDAFGDAFDGRNTNDTTEIRAFYNKFNPIVEEHSCCIIFNHHASKFSANNPPSKASALGSEAVVSKPRFAIELRPDYANNDIVHICITKGNYIPNSLKRESTAITMDSNLVFYPTGDHVPFADLVKPSATKEKRQTAPKDFPDDRHRNFLRAIFGGMERNQNHINTHVQIEFGVSDKPARKFIKYYEEKGMIKVAGKSGQSTLYKCLVK